MPQESVISQSKLIPIFIAYLKLQNKINPKEYKKQDIEHTIASVKGGFCNGFSTFIAHKFALGKEENASETKLTEAIKEINQLDKLSKIGFDKEGFFNDQGKFLESFGKLTRKDNKMVGLLEDIIGNMVWLQATHPLHKIFKWEEPLYKISPQIDKELDKILKEKEFDLNKINQWCEKLPFEKKIKFDAKPLENEEAIQLNKLFHEKGKQAVLNWLFNRLFADETPQQKVIEPKTLYYHDWDKMTAVSVGEGANLKKIFSLEFVFKKEELEPAITKIFSELDLTTSQVINLDSANHAILCYKELDKYYLWDPNQGVFFEPQKKPPFKEIAEFMFKQLHDVFEKNRRDRPNYYEFNIFELINHPTKNFTITETEVISSLLAERKKHSKTSDNEINTKEAIKESTALQKSALKGSVEMVKLLLSEGAAIEAVDKYGNTALDRAALEGHLNVVGVLLENKANIAATDHDGYTALHFAALKGHQKVVAFLLSKGAVINEETKNGYTALHLAAQYGHQKVIKILLTQGEDIERKTKKGDTALCCAAAHGQLETVKLLLKEKANIEAADEHGHTSLHGAAFSGQQEVVEFLLKEKPSMMEMTNINGYTALHFAAQNGHTEVVQLLLNKSNIESTVKDSNYTPLHLAAQHGRYEVVKLLLQNKADMTAVDNEGNTPLHLAALNGHHEVVELLLQNKADMAATENEGKTALHLAALKGHAKVVSLLHKEKANMVATDHDNNTALHWAARNGHKEVVSLLLNASGGIETAGHQGCTPLHLAAKFDNKEVVELLLNEGANIAATDNLQNTALHWAARNGHLEIVDLLLKRKADIAATDISGRTALHCAADFDRKDVVERLLQENPKMMDVKDKYGNTALHLAVQAGFQEVVKVLLQHNTNIEASTEDSNYTPLHMAAQNDHQEIVDLLIKKKANLVATDANGFTPLHFASLNGYHGIVDLFIKEKINMDIADYYGYTALHYAAQKGHKEVINLLLAAGAKQEPNPLTGETPFDLAKDPEIKQLLTPLKPKKPVIFQGSPLAVSKKTPAQANYAKIWEMAEKEIERIHADLVASKIKTMPLPLRIIDTYIKRDQQKKNKEKIEELIAKIEASIKTMKESTLKNDFKKLADDLKQQMSKIGITKKPNV